MAVPQHHGDHGGAVRIFVGHSKVVKCLLFTLFIYAAQFFPYQECNVRFKVRARMQLDLHGIIGQPALHFLVSYVLFTQLHMTNREQVLHRCALHIHTGWLTDLS